MPGSALKPSTPASHLLTAPIVKAALLCLLPASSPRPDPRGLGHLLFFGITPSAWSRVIRTARSTLLLPARPTGPCLKIEKRLLVTGSGEKVVQIPINLTPVRFMPGNDRFARILKSFKVSLGISVTEAMIGNHRNPGFEQLG